MDAYHFILKHGPSPNHWYEYIFCAYRNHRSDAVFLSGVPDNIESLPHGRLMTLSDQMLAVPLTVVGLGHEQSVPIF